MTWLHAVILGIIQGITEFLPISSSGHLLVIPAVLGWPEQGMVFDVTMHLATLLAIVIALRNDIGQLIKGCRTGVKADQLLVAKLLVATIPAVAVGVLLGDWLDSLRTVTIVAWMMILWGALLFLADYWPKKKTIDALRVRDVSWTQSVVIGVAQSFALISGTSRAGATMTVGLFSGLDRGQVARFSFLLAIPAILGAGAKTWFDVYKSGAGIGMPVGMLVIGFVTALVFGVLSIRFLFYMIRKTGFTPFAIYRIVFGVAVLLLVAGGVIAG